MAWQGIPFLMHEFDQTLGNTFLGFQPLKVLVEMSPKASADNTALWAAFIGATVTGLVALLSQCISVLSRTKDRNHQSRLMKYQLLLTIKQAWANDLRNEVATLISLSTAVYNLYSSLNELFDKNLVPSDSYDKAFDAQMEKKQEIGKVRAKLELLLGDLGCDESTKILSAINGLKDYFYTNLNIVGEEIDENEIFKYYPIINKNVRALIAKQLSKIELDV